jgi:hypothetical protein
MKFNIYFNTSTKSLIELAITKLNSILYNKKFYFQFKKDLKYYILRPCDENNSIESLNKYNLIYLKKPYKLDFLNYYLIYDEEAVIVLVRNKSCSIL